MTRLPNSFPKFKVVHCPSSLKWAAVETANNCCNIDTGETCCSPLLFNFLFLHIFREGGGH